MAGRVAYGATLACVGPKIAYPYVMQNVRAGSDQYRLLTAIVDRISFPVFGNLAGSMSPRGIYGMGQIHGRVLILDDEESILEVLTRAFESRGFRVDIVTELQAGLAHLSSAEYDLILCDVHLSTQHAPEFLIQVRELAPELIGRMIFMTGDAASERTRGFLKQWNGPVLMKPFTLTRLYQEVEEVIGFGDVNG